MKQRKVLVGIAIAIFIGCPLWFLQPCNNSLPDPDRFQIIGVYLQG